MILRSHYYTITVLYRTGCFTTPVTLVHSPNSRVATYLYEQMLWLTTQDNEGQYSYRNVVSKERIVNTVNYCLEKPITKHVHIRKVFTPTVYRTGYYGGNSATVRQRSSIHTVSLLWIQPLSVLCCNALFILTIISHPVLTFVPSF